MSNHSTEKRNHHKSLLVSEAFATSFPFKCAVGDGVCVSSYYRACVEAHRRANSWWYQSIVDFTHATDVVAWKGNTQHLLYLDNPKAGSTSTRSWLKKQGFWGWKTMSSNLTQNFIDRAFVFSIVRDPVKKFESGVREAHAQDQRLRKYSADELLDFVLAKESGWKKSLKNRTRVREATWQNKHLQANAWRLSAHSDCMPPFRCSHSADYGISHGILNISFLIKLEDVHAAFPNMMQVAPAVFSMRQNVSTVASKFQKQNQKHPKVGHWNAEPGAEPEPVRQQQLSERGIQKLECSNIYGPEFECLGYRRSTACDF